MSVINNNPTSYPEVNAILQELLESVESVLGSHFIGLYLEGSLANGDFDQDSDIDFIVVTDDDISENFFSGLQAMHDRIATLDSWYALQVEGSYISQYALRRFDPKYTYFPNIERGMGERLKMVSHDDTWGWIIHRYIMRRHGITIKGPSPLTLVDPILPDDLRQAMLPILHGWAAQILNNPNKMDHQGYQSYVVLSLCRILYTLHFGDVVSKPVAAQWAKESLDEKWVSLVERAWRGRHEPQLTATPEDVNQTLNFIRYAREQGEKSKI